MAQDNFGELCRVASEYGVLIALEYLPWTSLDTMKKAWDIVHAVNLSNGGIVLDTFHYFKGHPSRKELDEVPIEKIFIVHLDDLEEAETDLVTLTRRHRVAPGAGIFNFNEVLEYLFSTEYKGYYSLKILNTNHSLLDPFELATRLKLSTERLIEDYARKFEKVSPPGPGRGKY